MKDFLLMIQFLTRIPVKLSLPCEKENFKRGTMFFPLIGLTVGFVQWVVYLIFYKVLPVNIVALLVIMSGIIITGGFHIDGLGDTCDGFFAFKSGGMEKRIDIMKDSRIGTYSCIAIIFDILFKYASISSLVTFKLSLIIIAAPVVSKASTVLLCFIGNTAKSTGTGNLFIGNTGIVELIGSYILASVISVCLIGLIPAVSILSVGAVSTFLFDKLCMSKIGGLTGDSLGAENEIVEVLGLITFICLSYIKLV